MQILYPLFERKRILKKELLNALRDYTFKHTQIEYLDYEQGIIQGCNISVQNNELVVSSGLIKFGSLVFLIMDEKRIVYEPANNMQYLKIKIEIPQEFPDYIIYQANLFIDDCENLLEGEFEFCRFHLRSGAQLRCQYTGFTDLETEYDTVNQINASWSGPNGRSLAPAITKIFGETILSNQNSLAEDHAFAYLCLSHKGAVPLTALSGYILQKTGEGVNVDMSKLEIFHTLCRIVREISSGIKSEPGKSRTRHTIYVD